MLSEQQREILCVQGGYGPDEAAYTWIARRNVEGDARRWQIGHNNNRLVAGMRGDIDDIWGYDLYWLRAESRLFESFANDLSNRRILNALDVIEDPVTGEWVCRDPQAREDGCVPWNIFQEGAVTPESVEYMAVDAVRTQRSRTEVASLSFTGDLEHYGVIIPSASEGLQVAVGGEYRKEWMRNTPDEVNATSDTAGSVGSDPRFEGAIEVTEAFAEALLPIVQDVRGARDLSLELGYRYSKYSSFGGSDTYKVLGNWAISGSWRLRGGYNRAVRAPSLFELFYPREQGGTGYVDPCEGENPQATFEECARTGVTAEQYGNLPPVDPGLAFSNILWGGNPLLDPEVGDTITAGLVWTPESIAGLSVTLDYYRIEIADAIGWIPAETIHRVCMQTGDPAMCGLIHRDARGSLWLTPEGYTDETDQNVGSRLSEGIDVDVNYLLGLGNAGFVTTGLMGTYLLSQSLDNPQFSFECVGYFGEQCGAPQAKWRHRLRATWETSFDLNLSLAWRYVGSSEIDDASPNPDLGSPEDMELWRINGSDRLRPYNFFDLAASYRFRSVRLTLGINNILDEEPPLLPGFNDWFEINLYGNYDPLGRYIFASLQFEF
jgi:outer membrane receptor protein involved in Fe transport